MSLFEKYFPTICGSFSCLVIMLCYKTFGFGENGKDLLSAAIVFASILIGLIGVLMSTLFSVKNEERVELFLKYKRKEMKYIFKSSIATGFLLVILSMILYMPWTKTVYQIILVIWSFLIGYSFASMYRVLDIVFHIVFSETTLRTDEPEKHTMKTDERKKLQAKYERKKL